jgi:hypothetical protein
LSLCTAQALTPRRHGHADVIFASRCHFRLTRELEKKFSDRHVVFVAQRRILRKPTRTSRVKQKRPRSRTLTNVHEKILEDLVFPTEIVGKRTRVNQDGSKLLKVWVPADPSPSIPICTAAIPIGCSLDVYYTEMALTKLNFFLKYAQVFGRQRLDVTRVQA